MRDIETDRQRGRCSEGRGEGRRGDGTTVISLFFSGLFLI